LREKEAEIAENPNKHNFVQYLSSERESTKLVRIREQARWCRVLGPHTISHNWKK